MIFCYFYGLLYKKQLFALQTAKTCSSIFVHYWYAQPKMLTCVCFELRLHAYFVRTFHTVNKKPVPVPFLLPAQTTKKKERDPIGWYSSSGTKYFSGGFDSRAQQHLFTTTVCGDSSGVVEEHFIQKQHLFVCLYNIVHLCYTIQQKTSTMHVIKRGNLVC